MQPSSIQKILVIKMRHLGDVLLTTPLFPVLKKNFPAAQIDAYVYSDCKEVLEGNSDISEILTYDLSWKKLSFWKRLLKEFWVLKNIRNKRYDLILQLTEGDRGAIVCFFSKAKVRVGFLGKGLWGKKKAFTHRVKPCGSPRHAVEKNLDALRVLGIFPLLEERKLSFYLPQKAGETIDHLLENFSKEFILIHPTSRWMFKCWEKEKWKQLISLLLAKGKKVIVTGGKDPLEKKYVEDIVKDFSSKECLSCAGDLSLKELGVLIWRSSLFLCIDSVSLHIASSLQAKTLVLFGPSCDKIWGPWQNPHAKVIKLGISCQPCFLDGCGGSKKSDCLQRISVEKVFEEILHIL